MNTQEKNDLILRNAKLAPASYSQRITAYCIDLFLRIAVCGVLWLFYYYSSKGEVTVSIFLMSFYGITASVFFLCYHTVSEIAFSGQSAGKRLTGIRVCMDNGKALTLRAILLRNFVRCIDILPVCYITGGVVMLFHERNKRLGDIAAGTFVVSDERIPLPLIEKPAFSGLPKECPQPADRMP